MGAMGGVTARMRDDSLHVSIPVERYAGSGRIKNLNAIDLTDPQNLAEYERALNEEIERQKAIMNANDSVLPRWMRHGESVEQYNFADGELQNLLGAKDELLQFRQDLDRYNERASRDVHENASTPAAGRDSTPVSKGKAATGFNAAANGPDKSESREDSAEVAATRRRPVRPVAPS
jgi:hypothetical protein